MNSLPEEVIFKILTYLPARDLLHSRLLSKRYEAIIQKDRKHLKPRKITLELAFCSYTPVPEGEPGVEFDRVIMAPRLDIRIGKHKISLKISRNQVVWPPVRGRRPFKNVFRNSLMRGQSSQFSHFLERLLANVQIKQIFMRHKWDRRLLEIISEAIAQSPFPVKQYRIQMDRGWTPRAEALLQGISDSSKILLNPHLFGISANWAEIMRRSNDPKVSLVIEGGRNLQDYINHLKSLWSVKELQSAAVRAVYMKKKFDEARGNLRRHWDVKLIGITHKKLRKAYYFKDYPKEFTMVDWKDGSKLTFYFGKVDKKHIVTYNFQYN